MNGLMMDYPLTVDRILERAYQLYPHKQVISKLPDGSVSYRRYLKGKFLGKGGFARCFEFMNTETKQIQAAKIIQKSILTKSRARQKLMSEIKIHRSIKNPNVVLFQHFFEDSENVYILLELCSN